MKRLGKVLVALCMMLVTLVMPKTVQAKEEKVEFEFQSVVENVNDSKVIPENESWSIHVDNIGGKIYFPDIALDDIDNYEVSEITTDNKGVTITSFNEKLYPFALDGSGRKIANVIYYGKFYSETPFKVSITLKKGDQITTYTSESHVYKMKTIDMEVKEGEAGITSRTALAKLETASNLSLNKTYYFVPTIDGHSVDELYFPGHCGVDGNGGFGDMITSDAYTFYQLYDEMMSRAAGGDMTKNQIGAFKAVKPVSITYKIALGNRIGAAVAEVIFEETYTFSDPVDHTDTTTNVEMNADAGVLPDGTSLSVSKLENNTTVEKALQSIAERYEAYDISILRDNSKIQPNGLVTVRIPVSKAFTNKNLAVFYIDDEGNRTLLPSKLENGYLIFEATHFSIYAVVQNKEVEETKPEQTPGEEEQPSKPNDQIPPTNAGNQPINNNNAKYG